MLTFPKLHSSKKAAFTLVEVIVSIAILSTSLLAVFGVFRMCSFASVASQRLTKSTLLAEKLLTETRLEENISFQTRNGKDGFYDWQVKTSPTEVENLAVIEVTVQWTQQMREKDYSLKSLLYILPQYEGQ